MGGFGESNEQQITIRHIKPEIFSKVSSSFLKETETETETFII
jgi:hypothetical protein